MFNVAECREVSVGIVRVEQAELFQREIGSRKNSRCQGEKAAGVRGFRIG